MTTDDLSPAPAPEISLVSPAFDESSNLPRLYERIRDTLDPLGLTWEWVVVDDHSRDDTFGVVSELSGADPRVRGLRFARNFGSHAATACGLRLARGRCAVALASDLQDPPEVIPALVGRWREGAQIVWAVRAGREGESLSTVGFSRLYYWIMREVVGMKSMPPTGADFFLADRVVIDAFCRFRETNTSLFALLSWMGYRQAFLPYVKQSRLHGRSNWTFAKKVKLVLDSVTSFTYLPIRVMSYAGVSIALLGFLYALTVVRDALMGQPAQGWASLMVVVLVLGGTQMLMMGVLGEYLWRTFDESRRRPAYLIEAETAPGPPHDAPAELAPARGMFNR